jgi:hypothetical protein
MTQRLNGLEGLTDGATITAANSGGASGDAFDSDILNATASTTRASHGALSAKTSTSANTSSYVSWATTGNTWYGRASFFMTALPAANMQIVQVMSGSTGRLFLRVLTSGKLAITSSAFTDLATSTTTLATNTWYGIEFTVTVGGPAAGLAVCKLYTNTNYTTPAETLTASSTTVSAYDRIRFGANFSSAQTYSLWLDDLGLSDVGYLGSAGLITWADAGAATDTLKATAAASLADTASGSETLTATAAAPAADAAAGNDTLTVAAGISLADTASGSETLTATGAIGLADTGGSTEAITATATAGLPETGSGTDGLAVTAAAEFPDTGTATEALTIGPQTAPLTDTGAAADALTVTVAVDLADTGTVGDALAWTSPPAEIALTDTATGADALSVAIFEPLPDLAAAETIIGRITGTEAHTGELAATETTSGRLAAVETASAT